MHPAVRVGVSVVLVSWLLLALSFHQHIEGGLSPDTVQKVLDEYASEGTRRVNNYREMLDKAMNDRMEKLFTEYDVNGDGTISKEEFKGLSLGLLATASSIEVPTMSSPNLILEDLNIADSIPALSELTLYSIVTGWITLQVLFLTSLYVIENVRALLFPKRHSFHLEGFQTKTPPHVGKDIALRYSTPPGFYEKLKMAFFTFTGLVFVRGFLMLLFFFVAVFFIILSGAGGRTRRKNPFWFWCCKSLGQFFGHLMLASMGFYHAVYVGAPASAKDAKVIVGNHLCMVELVYAYLTYEFPSFVSRVENLSVPGFPGLCRVSDALLVDRSASDSRSKTKQAIRERATDPERQSQLMIFPEGTCANGEAIFDFKRGAFEPGAPIQMVATRFPHKHFNICWNGKPSGGHDMPDLFFRMLCQFINHVEVCYLPVYTPTDDERMDASRYATHTQQMLANVLGIATSDANFEDYAALAKSHRRKEKLNVVVEGPTPGTSPQMKPMKLQ